MALTRRAALTAFVLSFALHAGAAFWVTSAESEEEPAMMEGGPGLQMAVSGDPFDALAGGEETGEVETASVADTVEAIEAEPVETAEMIETADAPAEAVTEDLFAELSPELPSEPAEPVEEASSETTEVAERVDVAPVEPDTTRVAPVTETVKAMDPQPDNVPQPTRRPNPPPRQVAEEPPERAQPKRTQPKRQPEARRAERTEAASGNRGRSQANARRGSRESGRAAQSGGGRSGVNASQARSNYSGQVLSRIRSAQRYPNAARRQRAQGTATVSFMISARGGASSIRLVRSSGNPLIDRAAVDTVRRASPFPPIPREAGQRSMSFSVPIRFQLR